MSRHTARRHALHLIFQFPFHLEWNEQCVREAIDRYLADLPNLIEDFGGKNEDFETGGDDFDFIYDEVNGTFKNRVQIDSAISERLVDWDFDRVAKINLALLRLAVYEMRYSTDKNLSTATAINQAVELAKIYGADDSPAFVNGLLGRIAGKP